jgi:hypothetical protein
MSEVKKPGEGIDLNLVQDPDVRRTLRALQQQMAEKLTEQQYQIDAMLEMMLEKHIGSIGEFKRHLLRVQQKDARSERLHDTIVAAAHAPAGARPGPQPGAGR